MDKITLATPHGEGYWKIYHCIMQSESNADVQYPADLYEPEYNLRMWKQAMIGHTVTEIDLRYLDELIDDLYWHRKWENSLE